MNLPEFVLTDARVALDEPASGLAAPVSALRFEPRVDLQTRNFGEAQGDVSIRGGIFEGTAVQVGGATVFDPQTGHYAMELPIPAGMLSVPIVRTGAEHCFYGMNATAGTIAYDWRPIVGGGSVSTAFGNGALNRQSVRAGRVFGGSGAAGATVAAEGEIARSEGDGTIRDGDHRFFRLAGRIERTSDHSRTRLFAGYQKKFFGWPNLYTPFGVAETEDLRTTLVMFGHDAQVNGNDLETGVWYRLNRDDYEFDRYRPGLFNPYQHETRAGGAFAQLARDLGPWKATARGEAVADGIESTSLTSGRFMSRSTWRLAAQGSRFWDAAGGDFDLRLGGAYDDTNREGAAFSPLLSIGWTRPAPSGRATLRFYAESNLASRVPGYTALNSSAAGGLFRGNPDLGREKSRNLEAGVQARWAGASVHAAIFRREDDPLVDWTFSAGAPNARTARDVAVVTTGVEVVAARTWERLRVVAGYTWLEKDADYFGASVDASFYALNFARHRVTLAVTARLGWGLEFRSDHEWRLQAKNSLRTRGGDEALLGSAGFYWIPAQAENWEFSLVADNLWQSDFQELPAVPAPGRQVTADVTWRW